MKSKELVQASPTLCSSELRTIPVVWDASFGEAAAPIPDEIVDSLKRHAALNSYPPVQGLPELRGNWSNYLTECHDVSFNKENMVITPGSKFALQAIFAVLSPSLVIIPTPAWVGYCPCAEMGGHEVQYLTCDAENCYKLRISDLDFICKAHCKKQIVLVLNSPNNPTGAVYSKEEMEAICVYCGTSGIIVVFDGIYAHDYSFTEERLYTPLSFIPYLTIYVGGMSKMFGMGGRRLGFCHIPEADVRKNVIAYLSSTVSGVDIATQTSVADYFASPEKAMDYVKDWYSLACRVSRYVEERLNEIGLETSSPEGGFYIYTNFSPYRSILKEQYQVMDSKCLAEVLLSKVGIRVLPASIFADHSLAVRIVTQCYKATIVDERDSSLTLLLMKHGQEIVRGLDQLELFILNLDRSVD